MVELGHWEGELGGQWNSHRGQVSTKKSHVGSLLQMCQKWVQHATPPKFTQIFPKIFPQNFPKWLFQQGKLYKIMINHSWSLLIETSQPRNIPLWKKHKNTFCVKKNRTKLRGTLFSDNSILLLQISHHPSKCWTRLCRSVGADGRVQIQRGAHPSHARCRLVAGCPLKPLFNYETWAARVHDFVNDILIWSHFLCKNNTRFFKVFSGCYFISFVHWSNAGGQATSHRFARGTGAQRQFWTFGQAFQQRCGQVRNLLEQRRKVQIKAKLCGCLVVALWFNESSCFCLEESCWSSSTVGSWHQIEQQYEKMKLHWKEYKQIRHRGRRYLFLWFSMKI